MIDYPSLITGRGTLINDVVKTLSSLLEDFKKYTGAIEYLFTKVSAEKKGDIPKKIKGIIDHAKENKIASKPLFLFKKMYDRIKNIDNIITIEPLKDKYKNILEKIMGDKKDYIQMFL